MINNEPLVLFSDLPQDPRTEEQRLAERSHAETQAGHLMNADQGRELRRLLDRRRGSQMQQFESANEDGTGPLIASRSFLLPAEAGQVDREDELQSEFGLRRVADSERSGLVVIESDGSRTQQDDGLTTVQLAEELRSRGFPVQLNYIVPLGGVIIKAKGGPEPTVPLGEFRPPAEAPLARPTVAVIDTGISREQRTDGWLHGLVDPAGDNIDELDLLPAGGDGFLDAAAGHGTHVAGVVQQVAPGALIRMYRGMDTDGVTTDRNIADLMVRAAQDGADVINLSLGTRTIGDVPPPEMTAAVRTIAAEHPQVVIVAAAGNHGSTTPVWPAALAPNGPGETFDNLVAVAGLDHGGAPSTWSTRGPWVTFSAVGTGVASTYVIGKEDGELIEDDDPDEYGPDSWATWTGTSFAAPQVAGAIARICYEQELTADQALATLLPLPTTPDWGRKLMLLPGT